MWTAFGCQAYVQILRAKSSTNYLICVEDLSGKYEGGLKWPGSKRIAMVYGM